MCLRKVLFVWRIWVEMENFRLLLLLYASYHITYTMRLYNVHDVLYFTEPVAMDNGVSVWKYKIHKLHVVVVVAFLIMKFKADVMGYCQPVCFSWSYTIWLWTLLFLTVTCICDFNWGFHYKFILVSYNVVEFSCNIFRLILTENLWFVDKFIFCNLENLVKL